MTAHHYVVITLFILFAMSIPTILRIGEAPSPASEVMPAPDAVAVEIVPVVSMASHVQAAEDNQGVLTGFEMELEVYALRLAVDSNNKELERAWKRNVRNGNIIDSVQDTVDSIDAAQYPSMLSFAGSLAQSLAIIVLSVLCLRLSRRLSRLERRPS